MSKGNQNPQPEPNENDKARLMQEYELCQNAAQSLEATIWQTGAAIGIGSVGSLILVATAKDQPAFSAVVIIGTLGFVISLIWLFMARRWWSIQHTKYLRMSRIEEILTLYQVRYVDYLDDLHSSDKQKKKKAKENLLQSGLSEDRVTALEPDGRFPQHQRKGIRKFVWLLPLSIFIAWVVYAIIGRRDFVVSTISLNEITLNDWVVAIVAGLLSGLLSSFIVAITTKKIIDRRKKQTLKDKFGKADGTYKGYRFKKDEWVLEEKPASEARITYKQDNNLSITVTSLEEKNDAGEPLIWTGEIAMELENFGGIAWQYTNLTEPQHRFGFKRCIVKEETDKVHVYLIGEEIEGYGEEVLIRDKTR